MNQFYKYISYVFFAFTFFFLVTSSNIKTSQAALPTSNNTVCIYNSNSDIASNICSYYVMKRPGAVTLPLNIPDEAFDPKLDMINGQHLFEQMSYENFKKYVTVPLFEFADRNSNITHVAVAKDIPSTVSEGPVRLSGAHLLSIETTKDMTLNDFFNLRRSTDRNCLLTQDHFNPAQCKENSHGMKFRFAVSYLTGYSNADIYKMIDKATGPVDTENSIWVLDPPFGDGFHDYDLAESRLKYQGIKDENLIVNKKAIYPYVLEREILAYGGSGRWNPVYPMRWVSGSKAAVQAPVSNRAIIDIYESFFAKSSNSLKLSIFENGTVADTLTSTAFGGTNYSRSFSGGFGTVEEPTTLGVIPWESAFPAYASGKTLGESYLISNIASPYGIAVGDPLMNLGEQNFQPNKTINKAPDVSLRSSTVTLPDVGYISSSAVDDGIPKELNFDWTKVDGPGNIEFLDKSISYAQFKASNPGKYTLRFTVTDGIEQISRDATVIVNPIPNKAPLVNAGTHKTINVNSFPHEIQMDATAIDPDGESKNLTLEWSQVTEKDKPVTFICPNRKDTSCTNPKVRIDNPGNYIFRIYASDKENKSGSLVKVTVLNGDSGMTDISALAERKLIIATPSQGSEYALGVDTLSIAWLPINVGVKTIQLVGERGDVFQIYGAEVYNDPVNYSGKFDFKTLANSILYPGKYITKIIDEDGKVTEGNKFIFKNPTVEEKKTVKSFQIEEMVGLRNSYGEEENIIYKVKVVEPDGTTASSAEGFSIQSIVYPLDQGIKKAKAVTNATYNDVDGYWIISIAPFEDTSKMYGVTTKVYCGKTDAGTPCMKYSRKDISVMNKFVVNRGIKGVDNTAPSIPRLEAVVDKNSVQLKWNPSTDNIGVAGYKLYRATKENVTGAIYAILGPTVNSYIDPNLQNGAWYVYAIAAYDTEGNQSRNSSPTEPMRINYVTPVVPTNVSPTSVISDTPTISPSNVINNNLKTIRVLSPNGGENFEKGRQNKITWTETGLDAGEKFSIHVIDTYSKKVTDIATDLSPIILNGVRTYNWTIPESLRAGSVYKIEVRTKDVRDISDNNFRITTWVEPTVDPIPLTSSPIVTETTKTVNTTTATATISPKLTYTYTATATASPSPTLTTTSVVVTKTTTATGTISPKLTYTTTATATASPSPTETNTTAVVTNTTTATATATPTPVAKISGVTGAISASTVKIGGLDQILGGFHITVENEPVIITNMAFLINILPMQLDNISEIAIVDKSGNRISVPVNSKPTSDSGTPYNNVHLLSISSPVKFPVGSNTYYFRGNVPRSFPVDTKINISTSPALDWVSAKGAVTGKPVDVSNISPWKTSQISTIIANKESVSFNNTANLFELIRSYIFR